VILTSQCRCGIQNERIKFNRDFQEELSFSKKNKKGKGEGKRMGGVLFVFVFNVCLLGLKAKHINFKDWINWHLQISIR
jgi:hypothetical protein